MPRFGCFVVNGYGAISGVARDSRDSSVDLPGVREADQPGVGDDLQFERDPALFALLARLELPRGAVGRALEVDVAATALAALRDDHFVAGLRPDP